MARPIQSGNSGEMAQMIAMMMEFESRRDEREADREERREQREFQERQFGMQEKDFAFKMEQQKQAALDAEGDRIMNTFGKDSKQYKSWLKNRYPGLDLSEAKKKAGLLDSFKRNMAKSFEKSGTVGMAQDLAAKSLGGTAAILGGGESGGRVVHDLIKKPLDTASEIQAGLDPDMTQDIPLGFAQQREDALKMGISVDELRQLRARNRAADVTIPERQAVDEPGRFLEM